MSWQTVRIYTAIIVSQLYSMRLSVTCSAQADAVTRVESGATFGQRHDVMRFIRLNVEEYVKRRSANG